MLPRQPACSALSVGSIITDELGATAGGARAAASSALSSAGSSSRPKNSARERRPREHELDHHRERALHVAARQPVHALAVAAAGRGCPGPGRCRGGRRAAPARPRARPARRCRRGRAQSGSSLRTWAASPRLVTRLRRDVDQLERPGGEPLAQVAVARRHERAPYAHALLRHRRLGASRATSSSCTLHERKGSEGVELVATFYAPGTVEEVARTIQGFGRGEAVVGIDAPSGRRLGLLGRRRARARDARPARRRATSACACATPCSTAAGSRSTRSRPPTSRRRSG